MRVTPTELRQNIYALLDQALETGVPIEIERKGKLLRIVPEQRTSRLARLKKRSAIIGNPDDLIHVDWSKEWSELK